MPKRNYDKDAVIAHLKREKIDLEAQVNELKYIINDIQVTNQMMHKQVHDMCEIIETEVAAECGCVILANNTYYQDFVGILLNNGYIVEVESIHKERSLKITIKEGEE